MIKTLRYSLLSMLMLVCGSVAAQKETLWAENFNSYAAGRHHIITQINAKQQLC